mmetsp:Transcript_2471/g.3257  ORF Transcript_2471/g.3257 Transcript_2471/m.3257 type:complete len:256 (-) Transcript_2471:29-796(-)
MPRFGSLNIRSPTIASGSATLKQSSKVFSKHNPNGFNWGRQSTTNTRITLKQVKTHNHNRSYKTSTIPENVASFSKMSAASETSQMGLLALLLGLFAGAAYYEEASADEPKIRDVPNPFLKKGEKPKLKIQYDEEKEEIFTQTISTNTATEYRFAGKLQELVEEVGFWTVFNERNKIGLNQRIETSNFFPVKPNTKLEIRGKIESANQKRIVVRVIVLDNSVVLSSSKLTYILADFNAMSQLTGQQTGNWNPYVI